MVLIVRVQPAMKCPDQVQLSRADGEALRIRLTRDTLTADDRHVLDQVLQWYFWLLFALQEATFSLKRLRAMLFGEKPPEASAGLAPGRYAGRQAAEAGGKIRVLAVASMPLGPSGYWGTRRKPWPVSTRP